MKKNLLLCSMFLTSFVCAEEFVAQKFTWTYAVQAKDSTNLETLSEFNTKLRNLITEMNDNSARSTGADVYSNFLTFVKEMQEAILAGANLFGSVVTAQEPLVALVEEVVEQIAEQACEEQTTSEVSKEFVQTEESVATENQTEMVTETAEEVVASEVAQVAAQPGIFVTFACTVTDASQEESWNAAVNVLQAFANKINNNEITPEEFIASLTEIYSMLSVLEGSGLGLAAF